MDKEKERELFTKLKQAIKETLRESDKEEIPLTSIIGCLEMIKQELFMSHIKTKTLATTLKRNLNRE